MDMAQQRANFVIRTKMAEAMLKACAEVTGTPDKGTRKLVRHVLTVSARGVGTKYDSSKKRIKAETAVEMKEAA
jgi:hypothetical protein